MHQVLASAGFRKRCIYEEVGECCSRVLSGHCAVSGDAIKRELGPLNKRTMASFDNLLECFELHGGAYVLRGLEL